MNKKKIIAMGFMAQCPIAGVIWQHIHYIVALQRLGHEVWYVEDTLNPSYNPVTFDWGDDSTYAAHILGKVAREYGFEGRWAYCARNTPNHDCFGLTKQRMIELYREADMILNICGSQEFNDDILQNPCIIYVESDPTVEQIMVDNGGQEELDYLRKHHALFTFGENIGTPAFPVPLHGLKWRPTRQPVVTDFWKSAAPALGSDARGKGAAVFTTIANWSTTGVKDMPWQGDIYVWSKAFEFLKFVEAPARSGEDFEMATAIPDEPTRNKFASNRWRLVSPEAMSVDYEAYRKYIQASKGEFTAAKDQYIRLNTAWFSDRSACYLAAGRPVITQETGFTKYYGGHGGLFAFSTMEEIVEAVREINADYPKHCRLAHEIACEYFEAEKVMASLLDRAGV